MTTAELNQDLREELAASADALALQNGEITHAEHARREQAREYDRFWASGQVGTD